ncbi:MAG: NUDIX hydrolase [Propionibacteriaceae bacterium]|jgi:8-oxo-dGTP diphosphatase|nr:NUDIX hydrolase [Propionibacteriaceae bacterium]
MAIRKPVKKTVLAAGTVVLRDGGGDEPEVLLVHRPRYNDWSLPKGKLDEGEYLAECAVRETLEEANVSVRLSVPLTPIEYPIVEGVKRVHYWLAYVREEFEHIPCPEVDKIRWLPLSQALEKVTYPEEPDLILQAGQSEGAISIIVARHATACSRAEWGGSDDDGRPLSGYGKLQAKHLAALLDAYGVERLIASTAKRCRRTFKPYAKQIDGQVEGTRALTESESWQEPDQVKTIMHRALRHALKHHQPTAICGHLPTLPLMLASLGVVYRNMKPATAVVIHFSENGETLASEFVDSTD